ncbi:hypothetical protein MAMT_01824 [Methylacidimicrobium tartarophylax]|uniref:Uncharacterized protein n=1 Tax=Methylacidimicrobium tartarophylax TaxID=1041768 RepID=A0A5E6MQ14_9BACT|nr:hypothetical protein MAMT_01824 [Methylacidimicrobium tartarophylax]
MVPRTFFLPSCGSFRPERWESEQNEPGGFPNDPFAAFGGRLDYRGGLVHWIAR